LPVALRAEFRSSIEQLSYGPPGPGAPALIRVSPQAAQHLHPGPRRLIAGDQHEKAVLLRAGQPGDVGGERARILLHLGQIRAGLRHHREEIGIEAEEIGESTLRGGQRAQPGRHRRLQRILILVAERVLITLPPAVCRQPRQIQPSQVTGGEFGTDAHDGRQRVLCALHPLPRIILAGQLKNHRLRRGCNAYMAVGAVLTGDLRAEQGARQPEHDLVSAPVRQIQMRVVVTAHHRAGIAPEIPDWYSLVKLVAVILALVDSWRTSAC
jgi:hypothetical protein